MKKYCEDCKYCKRKDDGWLFAECHAVKDQKETPLSRNVRSAPENFMFMEKNKSFPNKDYNCKYYVEKKTLQNYIRKWLTAMYLKRKDINKVLEG